MLWKVAYTNDRADGMLYYFTVEASSSSEALMRAGMARAESFVTSFYKGFYWPHPVQWKRVSIKCLS